MKMSKVKIQAVSVIAAVLAAFSVAVFAIPFPKGAVFWIAYIAEVIAVVMQLFVFKCAFEGSEELKSKVLGFPLTRVGYVYLIVQTVISIIFFVLGAVFSEFPVGITVAVCVVVLAAAFVFAVVTDAARDIVKQVESEASKSTPMMKQLKTECAALPILTDNAELKAKLEKLSEQFRFSDPVSAPELEIIEDNLLQQLSTLREMVVSGDGNTEKQIDTVSKTLAERNVMCKNYKR